MERKVLVDHGLPATDDLQEGGMMEDCHTCLVFKHSQVIGEIIGPDDGDLPRNLDAHYEKLLEMVIVAVST